MSHPLKIALINPESGYTVNYFPTGLCYLSSYLKKYLDYKVEIKILNLYDTQAERLSDFNPSIIGISSFTHNFYTSIKLSRKFRIMFPDSLIILGGCHISVIPESLKGDFNFAVIGEGEQTFLKLVTKFIEDRDNPLTDLDGLAFKTDRIVKVNKRRALISDLDSIPFPARESIEDSEKIITTDHPGWFGRTGLRTIQLTTSRGCPYKCIFCQPSAMWEKYRMNSASYIAEEIGYMHHKFGINSMLIEDDLFTGSKKRIAELIELLSKQNIIGKIIYYVAGRTSQIDEEWAELLKTLGVYKVEFGIESGSDKVAQYLKTGKTSTEVNKRAISILNKHGIGVFGSFIAGAPIETKDDLKLSFDMIKWIKNNHKNNSAGIGIATPLPSTGLWDYAVGKGLIDVDNFDWNMLSVLKNFPKSPDDFIHLNENIPAGYILKETRKLNFQLKVGTPMEFIRAIPRRTKKLIKKILN